MKKLIINIILIALLGFLIFFLIKGNLDKKSKLTEANYKIDKLTYLAVSAEKEKEDLYNAARKTDTIHSKEIGDIKRIYQSKLDESSKLLDQAVKNDHQPIISIDTNTKVKTLSDGYTDEDLTINYKIDYKGEFYGIDLSWEIYKKKIIENKIIYKPEPYEVIKEVHIDKRMLYIGTSIMIMDKSYLFFELTYLDRKKFMYRLSIDPINKIYLGGFGFRLFMF